MPWKGCAKKASGSRELHDKAEIIFLVIFTINKCFSMTRLVHGVTGKAERMVDYLRQIGDLWRTLRSKPVRLNDFRLEMDNARPQRARPVHEFSQKSRGLTL